MFARVVVLNPPRCTAEDYIQFPLATPWVATATEAARAQPDRPAAPAHDALPRLLTRPGPDPAALWQEVRPLLRLPEGVLERFTVGSLTSKLTVGGCSIAGGGLWALSRWTCGGGWPRR